MKILSIFWLFSIALISGCSEPETSGDGNLKTESRPIADFSGLVANGAYQIKWASGAPALSIEAEQNLLPLIKTTVDGTNLNIDVKGIISTKPITVTLSSNALTDVNLHGASTLSANNLSGPSLKLESEGTSVINLGGAVPNLDANLKGASKLLAKAMQTQNAKMDLAGIATAEITVTETLDASVAGTAVLNYAGNPKKIEKKESGLGKIQPQ